MRMTSKGQVTIPVHIRQRAGLMPNSDVDVSLERGKAVVSPKRKNARRGKPTRGELIVKRLTGTGDIKMTTDEIMALTRGD